MPSPRLGSNGAVESIGWVLPIDDTHFRIYVAGRVEQPGDIGRMRSKMNGKFWWELSEAEHRQFPGDYEAQVSQGAITAHSAEHLRTSDRGVALLRRFLREQLRRVAPARIRRASFAAPATPRCASPTAATSSPHELKVLLATQPMPAKVFIAAIRPAPPISSCSSTARR